MAIKTHSYSAKLQYSTTGAAPFTDLTDIKSITMPELERTAAEITHLESAGQWREYMRSWLNPGEIGFVGFFTKAQYSALLGLLTAGTTVAVNLLLPLIQAEATPSKMSGNGFVSGCGINEINTDDEGAITCPFKFKATGAWTFTAGT